MWGLLGGREGYGGGAVMGLSTNVYYQPDKTIELCFHCFFVHDNVDL